MQQKDSRDNNLVAWREANWNRVVASNKKNSKQRNAKYRLKPDVHNRQLLYNRAYNKIPEVRRRYNRVQNLRYWEKTYWGRREFEARLKELMQKCGITCYR
jgi:hypothetical protein